MDFTIWVDGEETLRTRNTAEARKEYRARILKHVTTDRARVSHHLEAFDAGAETPGIFGVGVGNVEAMFHR